ncbi:uncharacterized protein BDZ99DRAFT_568260 [Mytilinidion resinicola]|uniref:non-specific serine/threonine protein kinase n=1 Tax=Mytilinidion resinicola TaxID=574789 RepID=A0A6A6YYJ3_9PEZI|nr:uncharacterized protein BDZ99DRAFT_568260 [Mytilinidion resinicola]KAF2812995.1 hypothetical protein BDZ99DRAFT_568260 [Mytilinidion resinicola]
MPIRKPPRRPPAPLRRQSWLDRLHSTLSTLDDLPYAGKDVGMGEGDGDGDGMRDISSPSPSSDIPMRSPSPPSNEPAEPATGRRRFATAVLIDRKADRAHVAALRRKRAAEWVGHTQPAAKRRREEQGGAEGEGSGSGIKKRRPALKPPKTATRAWRAGLPTIEEEPESPRGMTADVDFLRRFEAARRRSARRAEMGETAARDDRGGDGLGFLDDARLGGRDDGLGFLDFAEAGYRLREPRALFRRSGDGDDSSSLVAGDGAHLDPITLQLALAPVEDLDWQAVGDEGTWHAIVEDEDEGDYGDEGDDGYDGYDGDGGDDGARNVEDALIAGERDDEEGGVHEDDGGDWPQDESRGNGNDRGGQNENDEDELWHHPPTIIDLDFADLHNPAILHHYLLHRRRELQSFARGLTVQNTADFRALQNMGPSEYRFRLGELTHVVQQIHEELGDPDNDSGISPLLLSDITDPDVLTILDPHLRDFARGIINANAASFETRRAMNETEYRDALTDLTNAVIDIRQGQGQVYAGCQSSSDGPSDANINFADLYEPEILNELAPNLEAFARGLTNQGPDEFEAMQAMERDAYETALRDLASAVAAVRWSMMGAGPAEDPNSIFFNDLFNADYLAQLPEHLQTFMRGLANQNSADFAAVRAMDMMEYALALNALEESIVAMRAEGLSDDAGSGQDGNSQGRSNQNADDDNVPLLNLADLYDEEMLRRLDPDLEDFARQIAAQNPADVGDIRPAQGDENHAALMALLVVQLNEVRARAEGRAARKGPTAGKVPAVRGQAPAVRGAYRQGGGDQPPGGSSSSSSDDQSNGGGRGFGIGGGGSSSGSSGDSASRFMEALLEAGDRLHRLTEIPEPRDLPRAVLNHIRRRVVLIRNNDPAVTDYEAWYRAYRELLRIEHVCRVGRPEDPGDPIAAWYDAYIPLANLPRADRLRLRFLGDRAAEALLALNAEGDQRTWTYKKMLGAGGFGVARLYVKTDARNNIVDRVVIKIMRIGRPQGDQEAIQEVNNCREIRQLNIRYCVGIRGDNMFRVPARVDRPLSTQHSIFFEYCPYGTLEDLIKQWAAADDQIPELYVWHILRGMAEALWHLECGRTLTHGVDNGYPAPFVHFDIKPANIFVAENTPGYPFEDYNKPVLGDFGLGRFIPDWDYTQDAGGTRGFTAPEIDLLTNDHADFQNNRDALGRGRADIWSLGMTIWCIMRLVTTPAQISHNHPHPDDLPQPHPLDAMDYMPSRATSGMRLYSLDLEELVTACLSWRPQDRPSAGDLVRRINNCLNMRTDLPRYQENITIERLRPPLPSIANRDTLRLERRDPVGNPPAPGTLPNEIQLRLPVTGQWPERWPAPAVPDNYGVGGVAPTTPFRKNVLQDRQGGLIDPRAVIASKRRNMAQRGRGATWLGAQLGVIGQ